jgi:hypothetical protein
MLSVTYEHFNLGAVMLNVIMLSVVMGSVMAPLRLSLITECATEKASQFIMLLKSVYNKNVCLNNQKHIFEHCREINIITKSI